VNSRLFWRAAWIQLLVVAVPFAILGIALSHRFFVDWGFAVGPLLWVLCSLVTGRLVSLPVGFTLFCAAAGGVATVLVMLVFGHALGIVAGVGVFAACASGYDGAAPEPGERERLGPQSSTS
jgi:hypothetical protein